MNGLICGLKEYETRSVSFKSICERPLEGVMPAEARLKSSGIGDLKIHFLLQCQSDFQIDDNNLDIQPKLMRSPT